ncbi:MAG: ribosome small subunit-dependent GTPase A [Gemmatimonadota bacterium]
MPEALTGLVLGMAAGVYRVEAGKEVLECTLRGRIRQRDRGRVAVGDRVRVERLPDGSCRIVERLPRGKVLRRRGPTGRQERVIAANVDQVTAVCSVTRPDPDFRMIDRILALAELNDLAGLVVVNKIDLAPASPHPVPAAFEAYERAGYPVLGTSVRTEAGLQELSTRLAHRVSVFTGASGVGKSSLANRLIPGLKLRVGAVGDRRGRGRHTTVSASLIPLPAGGYLADTPGFQYVGVGEVPVRDLSRAFPEFRPHLSRCRFSDCRHREEPDCAVRAAVDAGQVAQRRYESYLTLLEEAGADV